LERKDNTKKEKEYLELSKLFSKPIVNDDDILDYVPTQYVAEYVKNLGYHGIAYSSLLLNYENYKDKYNLLIFNYDRCDIVKSNLYKVDKIIIEYEKDEERCKLVNYEDENLSNI
ncbi:MAG: RES domain-containing protein, partial [Eubacteriales bacterium]